LSQLAWRHSFLVLALSPVRVLAWRLIFVATKEHPALAPEKHAAT
jgi:hypothetical protein